MIIVGDNLKGLLEQHQIVSDARCFDNTSLSLSLSRDLILLNAVEGGEITYGHRIPEEWIKKVKIQDTGYLLPAKSCVLGCSHEVVKIPQGYFGLLQTKGSLARLFVFINCCDGQIDTGYHGKITFEIINMSNFGVRLLPRQKVAQLLIFKTSTRTADLYEGRYQGAAGPTIQEPDS